MTDTPGVKAAAAAIDRYCTDHGIAVTPGMALLMAEIAAPHFAAAARERLYAELGNDHYVIFTEDRWTIEHSVECRLGGHMHECGYHAAVALNFTEYDPGMAGRWRITGYATGGRPCLERAERAS